MLNVKNLQIEGFNPEAYARNYDDMEGRFLPYEVQRWWFQEIYPEGRIMTSVPTQDPEHNPGVYVSTASIWKNKTDENPDVVISARATPSDVDGIDPYQDCQRKAIAAGLKLLGFWIPVEKPSSPAVNPLTVGLAPATEVPSASAETSTIEEEPTNAAEEKPAEPKKRRGRKKAEPAPVEAEETPSVEEVSEETTNAPEPVNAEPEEKVVEEKAEPAVASTESEMTLEEAQNLKVGYRRFADMKMSELLETEEGKRLFNWLLSSVRAEEKLPEQVKAAKIMKAAMAS